MGYKEDIEDLDKKIAALMAQKAAQEEIKREVEEINEILPDDLRERIKERDALMKENRQEYKEMEEEQAADFEEARGVLKEAGIEESKIKLAFPAGVKVVKAKVKAEGAGTGGRKQGDSVAKVVALLETAGEASTAEIIEGTGLTSGQVAGAIWTLQGDGRLPKPKPRDRKWALVG